MNIKSIIATLRSRPHQKSTTAKERLARRLAFGLSGAMLLLAAPVQAKLGDYQTAVTNEPSLISYYTFDQATAADSRGTNDGTLVGTTAFGTGVDGAGQALQLAGAGRVNFGVVNDFAFDDLTGSIEAWVRPGASLGGNACLFANRESSGVRYSVHMNDDKSGIGMWNGAAYFPTVPIPNPGTDWHHLVVVFDNDLFTVYWDGVATGSTTRPLGNPGTTLMSQLGSSFPTAFSEPWVGQLDEVAYYADALTPEAVQAHYQALFAGSPPVIVSQPRSGTYLPNVTLQLNVQATGPNLAFQWYKGATALTGETANTLTFASLAPTDAGSYSVIVTNPAGQVTSDTVTIALDTTLPQSLIRYQNAVSNETSLISYYTFDRLTPEDVFGPNDSGALMGTAGWGGGVGGGAAQGLRLDGAGHVGLGNVPDFDFTSGTGTVEAWVRADWSEGGASSAFPCLIANRNGPTRWSIHMWANKSALTCYNGITSLDYPIPGGNAGTNWHHVVVVFDAGNATYYWDGTLIATLAQPISDNVASVQFGSSADPTTQEGWTGMLDEIAFYNSALSAGAVQTHYNAFYQDAPPVVTAQPVGGYFLVGQPLQLTAWASGAGLSYQWYKDNTPVPGQTSFTLSIGSPVAGDSGAYYLAVSNANGTAASAPATVQVNNDITRYQATVLGESSLISYYTFDNGDGQDTKNVHPGTLVSAVNFANGPGGVTNQSLSLAGAGHLALGAVPAFEFTSGYGTVEGWIHPTWSVDPGYAPCLFSDRDGASVWSIHMTWPKDFIGNWNNVQFQGLGIPAATGWHHYAVVFDNGQVKMYLDGQRVGLIPQFINFVSGKTTQIGSSSPTTTAEGWIGELDEVAFYSTALDDATLWNHYLAMVGAASGPALSITSSGTQVTLSWPATFTGYTLESSSDLPGTVWTPVGGVVNNSVTLNIGPGSLYFRLKK